jgi:hypothetical protein
VAAQRHLGRGWLNAFGRRASVTGWGYGPSGDAARGPDAGQAGGLDPGRRLHLRAQVGRVPVDCVPRLRRGGDRQQERAADDPLLPRAGDRLSLPVAAPVRHRRRDRAAELGQRAAGLRGAAAAAAPGREPGAAAGGADAGPLRRVRPAGAGRHFVCRRTVWRAAGRPRDGAGLGRAARSPDPGDDGERDRRGVVQPVRGGRARRADREAAIRCLRAR